MHPIEVGFRNKNILESKNCIVIFPLQHLYYFSCLVPSLLLLGSPFLLLWNGIHLLLSPGAPNISNYYHQVLQIFPNIVTRCSKFSEYCHQVCLTKNIPPRCRPQWLGGCPPIKSVSLLAPQVTHFLKSFFFCLMSLSIQSSKNSKLSTIAPQDLCLFYSF